MRLALLAFACAAGVACVHAAPGTGSEADRAMAAAEDAARAGRYDEAARSFRAAAAADPGRYAAHRGYVEAQMRLGRIAEPLAEYAARARAFPKDPVAHYGLGLAAFASGDGERAIAELREAATLDGKGAEPQHRLGVALLASERFAEAREALEKSVALEPKASRSWAALANARWRTGDRKGAIAALAVLPDVEPSPKDVAQGRELVRKMYDPMRGFPESLKKDLDTALDWLDKSDAPQEALKIFEEILRKFPDLAAVHTLVGLAWQRLDDAGHAIEAYTRAAELAPENPQPHLWLAELYAARDRRDRARAEFQAVLDRDPLNTDALGRDAEVASEMGDHAAAAARLRKLVALDRANADVRLRLARELMEQKEFAAAEVELLAVDRVAPRHPEVLLRLGLVAMERRNRAATAAERKREGERARAYFQQVLDAQPDNAAAQHALSELK